MTLSDFAIRRPVASIVMSLIIVLFGVVGYNFLGVRLYPAIDPPVITVSTSYTGANAEIIETQITEPIEKALNGIEGVKSISSSSSVGRSEITVEFEVGADLEKAANDVRDKASQATRQLPQDIDAPPVVSKADANSDPIITLSIISISMNAYQLSDYAENVLQEKLQTIPGVSTIYLYGQKRPAMRLWLDPGKMAACNITAIDVHNALTAENVELPGGKIRGNATELIIKTRGRLETEDDFNNLIIKQTNNQIVRLRDVGEAILGPENEESDVRLNGTEGISLAIVPLPGANDIEISKEFYKRLEDIKNNLPEGLTVDIGFDKTKFVKQSIQDVIETLIIALILVIIIVFLFFRDWLIALRPLIDIPVSLIGSFFIMYIFGFSINMLTMLAIVLATGLVVDDGIVVTENIFKKREQGMDIWSAALSGTREIFFAVISTSITLAVVFIPVIFLQGFTGRLFREFGIILAGSVLISAFVSLTLTPVLNIKLGGSKSHHTRFYYFTEPFFAGLENGYRKVLSYFIHRKWMSVAILFICVGLIFGLGSIIKWELAPLEDRSNVRTSLVLPESADFDYTQRVTLKAAQMIQDSIPEARLVFARVGSGSSSSPNTGRVNIYLTNPEERDRTQQQIYEKVNRMLRKNAEANAMASQEQTIATSTRSASSPPVQFVLQNLDFDKLKDALPKFMDEVQNSPVFSNANTDLKFNKPEINLKVNRLKATSLGVSEKDIANTLQFALSGGRYDYFIRNGRQYQVIGQMDRVNRNQPADITSLYVRNKNGDMIQLDNLVTMEEGSSPPSLYHFNRYKSATISASLAQGQTLGDGVTEMRRIAAKVLDGTFHTDLIGSSRDFAESSSNTAFALVFALVLIFLILAAQFESFRDPFIIMFTVPLAIAGALLSLWITGKTLNIFSEIGIIMLVGLVTKNGILIVEFSNRKRKSGLKKAEAAFEAASARLRPILMTSLATIFGSLPIALALGAGAQSRVPLGIVVVGGLLFALILTLFVIPVMYILLADNKMHQSTIDTTDTHEL
jgi:hydrophobe/amphiphile efflux-1 (HAE1) family protein